MTSECKHDARQTEIIIKAWPYKKEEIEEYCDHLGKNLNELSYSEAETMISNLKLRILFTKTLTAH
ncbi:MAG: hypothetical protein PHH67_01895 [Methanosarcina sp.]|jgi:hypothetical protein|nr:hypothetical protein [Methanosarcina sp.]MDD3316317.1 hypothetical protein [Methanosarcina sp.]MDD4305257.1 hypothetical protein [Methanosarcina sp.]MDD4619253.1 hypothetical protein [Methanosarcina sp.]